MPRPKPRSRSRFCLWCSRRTPTVVALQPSAAFTSQEETLLLPARRRDSARLATPSCVFLAAAFAFAACGGGAVPTSTASGEPAAATNAGASPTAELPSASVESSAAVQPSPASPSAATGGSPILGADAAANPSCTLFAPAETGALLKQSITQVLPQRGTAVFSSCVFIVDSWQQIAVSINKAAAGDNRTSGSFEMAAIQPGAKPLSGLGDKAFFIDIPGTDTLSVGALKGTTAIYLNVTASAPSGSTKPLDSLGSQTVLDAMKALVAVGLTKV